MQGNINYYDGESSSSEEQLGYRLMNNRQNQQQNEKQEQLQEGQIVEDQIYDSSSSQNEERQNEEKKKREDFLKDQEQALKNIKNVGEEEMLAYAYQAAKATNKKMLIIRKKNHKRMQQLQTMRMIQQNYLIASNTHFRGSVHQYPVITIDRTGKSYLHPNPSLKVAETTLGNFIKKNIAEQNTSNYLNEVVKYENYAYQQRKKRKHNFQ